MMRMVILCFWPKLGTSCGRISGLFWEFIPFFGEKSARFDKPVYHSLMFQHLFDNERARREAMTAGQVVPDPVRCVQCGICSFNCPIGIDVRRHAWLGQPVINSRCLTCGECVARCPRGVLSFEHTDLFTEHK